MAIFGYARVSTDGQTLYAQVSALKAAGAVRVFRETASGAKTDRRELAHSRKFLGEDTLLVTCLDRLARSTRDLLNMLDTIAKAGAGFRSLSDTWADTTTPHGRLVLTALGDLAEFEHELIRARGQGVLFGEHQNRLTPMPPHDTASGATGSPVRNSHPRHCLNHQTIRRDHFNGSTGVAERRGLNSHRPNSDREYRAKQQASAGPRSQFIVPSRRLRRHASRRCRES